MRMDRCSLRGYGLQTVLIPGCLKKAKKRRPGGPPRSAFIRSQRKCSGLILVAFHLVEEHVPVDLALMAADRLRLLHILLDRGDMAELCGYGSKFS